jgi:beta-phosphoglucomutase-like phosphatase (HAD superfamily)
MADAAEVVIGWTLDTLAYHEQAMREAADRRYAEVAAEREKALAIKERADRDALGLAREIQTYKDEKANELREQINSERGLYATKDDVAAATAKLEETIKPLAAFVAGQYGRSAGIGMFATVIAATITVLSSSAAVALAFYVATH